MTSSRSPLGRACAAALIVVAGLFSAPALRAAEGPGASGVVEGRVLHGGSGDYLENARVALEGTNLEAATRSDGSFTLAPLPAGTARLRVFFTGLAPQVLAVEVPAGATVRRDITLAPAGGRAGETVRLEAFAVAAAREMDAAAIAINEQRFASNLRTVVSTDEFGTVAEGHVGEFMKFLPGVTMEYAGGNAREISINGAPAAYVPVTVDGFNLASAVGNGTGRAAAVDMVSINGLSRLEVSYSPTPDSPGSALAGSVNMVSRSAFERARPVFNGSAYVMMRDNRRETHRTAIPRETRTRKVYPGFDFSWVVPINRNLGFSLSGGRTTQYAGQDFSQNTWRGAGAATNGAAFPHTTPDRPYLTAYTVRGGGKETIRNSIAATVDWRLGPRDRLTLALQASTFEENYSQQALTFTINRVPPGAFSPAFTRGDAGAGAGTLQQTNGGTYRFNRTYMPTLTWRHDGPVWKLDAGAGLSRARYTGADIERGMFQNTTAQRTNVAIAFEDIFYLRPGAINVRDALTGVAVDPFSLSSYALTGTTSGIVDSNDRQRTAFANARRDFGGVAPFSLRTGFDVREARRDLRPVTTNYAYVGADGRGSTTPVGSDDGAAPYWATALSERALPWGFPAAQWVSQAKTWEAFRATPSLFTIDQNARYRNQVGASKFASEVVSAAYLRGDLALLNRRLRIVGGLRAEQTNIDAQGPFTDVTRNYQRDAAGRVVTVASPIPADPARRVPAAIFPSGTLGFSQLTYLERGASVEKEYLRLFPNLNVSFNVRDNLILRAARYTSIGRPDFNQYAGGLTLPDVEAPPSRSNLITVNNAAIRPWAAESTNARVEYYFEGVGQVSAGVFRRDYENFASSAIIRPGVDFFDLYGIDAATYGAYEVATQQNIEGIVRTTGFDVAYKQSLTFLPAWARGLHAFANASFQRATGAAAQNFAGYVPRTFNWGLSLTRAKYNVRVNWNYRGRQRGNVVSGTGIEAGTYNWGNKKLSADVQAEYHLRKSVTVFANLRNVNNGTEDNEIAGPSTPSHAQFRQREDFGSLWTVGVKGAF